MLSTGGVFSVISSCEYLCIMSHDNALDEEKLQQLFAWVDDIPLSRKKKNLSRDFSDGVLVAEIIKHFFPRIIEIHNYISAMSVNQKMNNWGTLNRKVLSKLNYHVPSDVVRNIVECQPGAVENFLYGLWQKVEEHLLKTRVSSHGYSPEHRPYYNVRSNSEKSHPASVPQVQHETDYTVRNPIPLARLDLASLDSQTRLILEEKEQALLASQETVQILQVKIRRLEHLLHLKDLRLQDMEQKMPRYDSVSTLQSTIHR